VPAADGRVLYVAGAAEDRPVTSDIYQRRRRLRPPSGRDEGAGIAKDGVVVDPRGAFLLYSQSVTDNPYREARRRGPPVGRRARQLRRGTGRQKQAGPRRTGAVAVLRRPRPQDRSGDGRDWNVAGLVRRRLHAGLRQP